MSQTLSPLVTNINELAPTHVKCVGIPLSAPISILNFRFNSKGVARVLKLRFAGASPSFSGTGGGAAGPEEAGVAKDEADDEDAGGAAAEATGFFMAGGGGGTLSSSPSGLDLSIHRFFSASQTI